MTGSWLTREVFGTLANGETVESVTLTNANGMSVKIISYGASIQLVCVPDAHGQFQDVTAGHATLDEYIDQPQYFGATVGRVANRIRHGRFTLDGKEHVVPANDGSNSLHGGDVGFDKANWVVAACDEQALSVMLSHVSVDGDQGYPGNLNIIATYQLSEDNALSVTYQATTDTPTCVNISNHTYWNLGGEGGALNAVDHLLTINAEHYLPVDSALIPTGERRKVAGSVFDFRTPKRIRDDLGDVSEEQLRHGRGFDHNWLIADEVAQEPRPQAKLEDPHSGRTMTLFSNQPGLQFYSGNFLDGSTIGKSGKRYCAGNAIALEPQMFPDAPNQPSFASIALRPGQTYKNIIIWQFSTYLGEGV